MMWLCESVSKAAPKIAQRFVEGLAGIVSYCQQFCEHSVFNHFLRAGEHTADDRLSLPDQFI